VVIRGRVEERVSECGKEQEECERERGVREL